VDIDTFIETNRRIKHPINPGGKAFAQIKRFTQVPELVQGPQIHIRLLGVCRAS
jgi:hypothetical protein